MNVTNVRVDSYLTGFARDYNWNDDAWISDVIAPVKKVKSSSYKYKYYGKEATRNEVDDIKAPKGATNEVSYDIAEGSGVIVPRALKTFVDDHEIREAPDPVRPLEDATVFVMKRLKLLKEQRLVTLMAATSNSTTPTYDWDHASATPMSDIIAGKASFKGNLGKGPNYLVMGDDVADELSFADEILSNTKYQGFYDWLTSTADKMAARKPWGLSWLISSALYDTADAGATASLGRVIGEDAYLVRVESGSRIATWAIQPMCSDWVVTRWRDEDRGGWYVKVEHQSTFKEVTSEAIYKFTDVT